MNPWRTAASVMMVTLAAWPPALEAQSMDELLAVYATAPQGYPGGNSVRIWRQQREVIAGVMRGEIQPKAGLERMVAETEALMK